jgi:hypothetical protein
VPEQFIVHTYFSAVNATITSSTATPTMTSQASDVSFTKIPIPTASFETLTSSAAPTSRGDGSVQPTAYVTVSHQPSATSLSRSDSTSSRSLPLATIAGAAVGGSVLVALIIVILICLRRRRKQKSIYQAPIYISPYNSSRSFMPQKSPVYKAELRRSCGEIQQLDSRSIGVPRNLGNDSSRRFAELAVEPLTRRGV